MLQALCLGKAISARASLNMLHFVWQLLATMFFFVFNEKFTLLSNSSFRSANNFKSVSNLRIKIRKGLHLVIAGERNNDALQLHMLSALFRYLEPSCKRKPLPSPEALTPWNLKAYSMFIWRIFNSLSASQGFSGFFWDDRCNNQGVIILVCESIFFYNFERRW